MDLTTEEIVDGVATGRIKTLTSNDVARIIHKSRTTLDRWLREPDTCTPAFPQPIFVFGQSKRWIREQLVDWLDACRARTH
jgi:predicted DNA-binding transcriptional regulator AlpA